MRTITLVTQKGGTGKTTLAASLAVAAAQAGETVIALDLDPQGSLATWGDSRSAETLAVDRLASDRIGQLPAIMAALKSKGFTVAVLDTPGAASTGVNLAMQAADLCLIPARPSRLDLQATLPTIEALMRLGLKDRFAFVLNQTPPGRSSRAAGQGVTEFAPEGKAAEEVRALWGWISRKLKGKAHGQDREAVNDQRLV